MSLNDWVKRVKTILITRRKNYSTRFWPSQSVPYSFFILLCQPRTGSTLLHTYLNSHSAIYSYGEVLRRKNLKNKNVNLYRDVFKNHPPSIKAVGLKIFYSYSEDPAFQDYFNEIVKDTSIKVIHLTRENTLEEFISLKKAELTNQWSSEDQKNNSKDRKIVLKNNEFKEYLRKTSQLKKSISELFSKHNCLNISYEILTQRQEITLAEIQSFLNVPRKNLFTILKKQMSHQVNIENYNEISNYYQRYVEMNQ